MAAVLQCYRNLLQFQIYMVPCMHHALVQFILLSEYFAFSTSRGTRTAEGPKFQNTVSSNQSGL